MEAPMETLEEENKRLKAELAKAAAFKAFVHKRLDEIQVPEDPYPVETKETGCRIGSRLSWVYEALWAC